MRIDQRRVQIDDQRAVVIDRRRELPDTGAGRGARGPQRRQRSRTVGGELRDQPRHRRVGGDLPKQVLL